MLLLFRTNLTFDKWAAYEIVQQQHQIEGSRGTWEDPFLYSFCRHKKMTWKNDSNTGRNKTKALYK